ncbi:uncharacterized protein LOC141849667 [Brevipalpus obovatus]|uniref:uncharacterized protein LOC141849667 n=1 Tax=Brevipalpus obovatus TaxID=246614 RepID=UPI003D9DD8A8
MLTRSSKKPCTKRLQTKSGHVGRKSKVKLKASEKNPSMDKQPSGPEPSSGKGPFTLPLDYWRTHLQSGITFCLYVDSIIKDYKDQNIADLKRYSQEDLLKGLMLYGMYPCESGRFKVLVKRERLDSEKLDKLDIYRKVRNILPDVDAMQMDVHWKEFMELCSERLFPLETRKKTETSKETPLMDKQSIEPGPSSGGEPSTGEDDHWREQLQSGGVLFFIYIDGLYNDYKYHNIDELKQYSLEDLLKGFMLWRMYPRMRDIERILVNHERLEPMRVHKFDIYPMVRRILPYANYEQMDVYWKEFMDLCSEFVFPL